MEMLLTWRRDLLQSALTAQSTNQPDGYSPTEICSDLNLKVQVQYTIQVVQIPRSRV